MGERLHQRVSSIIWSMESVPFALCMAVVALFPQFYSQGAPWWLPLALIPLTVAAGLYGVLAWWCGREYARPRFSTVALLFAVPLLLCAVQLIPHHGLVNAVAPANGSFWSAFNEVALLGGTPTISLAPDGTIGRALLLVVCGVLFLLVTNCVHTHQRIRIVLLCIMVAALGNAVIAFLDFFGDNSNGMGNDFRGTFLNRNHFAFLMMMGAMAAASLLAITTIEHSTRREDSSSVWIKLTPVFIFAVFVLLTAQVLSLSRGAFIGSALSLTIFTVIWLARSRTVSRESRQKFIVVTVILGLALAHALPVAMTKLAERYEQLNGKDLTMDSRWLVWKDSMRMLKDHWQLGVGQGAYGDSIQRYEGGNISFALIDHAHNDFVELACEIGVPAMAFLVLLGLVLWLGALRRVWKSEDYVFRWAGLGMLVTVVGVCVHEMADFNLQAWCNAVSMTAILSVIAVCSRRHSHLRSSEPRGSDAAHSRENARSGVSSDSGNSQEKEKETAGRSSGSAHHHHSHWNIRMLYLILTIVAFSVIPFEWRAFAGALARADLVKDMNIKRHRGEMPTEEDFKRRMRLVEACRQGIGNETFFHRRKAIIAKTFADTRPANQFELLREAVDEISEAARRAPGNGMVAMQCARYARQAKYLAVKDIGDNEIIKLYNWACVCYPTLTNTREEAAFAAYDRYLNTPDDDEALSKAYLKDAIEQLTGVLAFEDCNRREIFRALFYLLDDPQELVKLIPANFRSMMMLAELYLELNYPTGALNVAKLVNEREKTGELTLSSRDRLAVQNLQTVVYERLEDQMNRKSSWDSFWAIPRETDTAREVREFLAGGELRRAEATLEKKLHESYANAELILLNGKLKQQQGHQEDMVIALTPLAYGYCTNLENEHLVEAIRLIDSATGIQDITYLRRASFLKAAMQIMLAERGNGRESLAEALKTLDKLSVTSAHTRRRWIQIHLVPLFQARGAVLEERMEDAVKSLRECLEICPNNRQALEMLFKIAPDRLTEDEAQLLGILHRRPCPISRFACGLLWLGVGVEPDVLRHIHEQQKFTYYFECVDDIAESIRIQMVFLNNGHRCFTDSIGFANGYEFTLRIGEIVTVTREWQTALKSLTAIQRVPANGTISVGAQGVKAQPKPAAIVGRVEIK